MKHHRMRALALLLAALLCAPLAARAQKGKEDAAGPYVAQLCVYGDIDLYGEEYDHYATLDAIDGLAVDPDNLGLILLLDTPGGGLYEADELYHALAAYREDTGRPVYAYMESECCSAGVYAAMAAQEIYASRMTLTGSVGVYMEESSDAQMLEKLGIRSEFIVSGENKLNAPDGLTDEQRAIAQGIVDEGFDFFVEVIRDARGEATASDPQILDGRLLTATQAKDKGLIDGLLYYDEAIDRFYELGGFGDAPLEDVTPDAPGGALPGSASDLLPLLLDFLKQGEGR